MHDDIQVSVCVVTYNQEKYITECLDSIVSQETDFNFEVIIGEDCSTDNTRQIVQQYADRYPDLIVPVFHEKNVGAVENIKQVYKKAKGKYIAHIDGDDMMLPNKLQKQFDILESNPDCAICVHHMRGIDNNSKVIKNSIKNFDEKKYNLLDMYLINPFFIHSSKMFINEISGYIDCLDKNALDTEVHIEQVKQGFIYFLKEELGCYRMFVGVTYEKELVSQSVRDRIQYVYDNIDETRFTNEQLNRVREKYALILLQYAYLCGVIAKDAKSFKMYTRKSLSIKKIGFVSYIFKTATIYPEAFFKILQARKKLKQKIIK